MAKASNLEWISWIIVTIGAINVGLDGLFDFDVVEMLLGDETTGAKIVSGIIGLAGVYSVLLLVKYAQKKK